MEAAQPTGRGAAPTEPRAYQRRGVTGKGRGGRAPLHGFGDLERAVMEVVWAVNRPVTGREVVDALVHERTVAYTTVMTVMDRLAAKRVLVKQRTGRAHTYRAVESRDAHIATLLRLVLQQAADPGAALVRFVQQLPPAEAARLRAALDACQRGASGSHACRRPGSARRRRGD
jgi:predicted transcriptional regulator